LRDALIIYVCSVQDKRRRDTVEGRPLEVFMCSVLERHGCAEAFRWLANYLNWIRPNSLLL